MGGGFPNDLAKPSNLLRYARRRRRAPVFFSPPPPPQQQFFSPPSPPPRVSNLVPIIPPLPGYTPTHPDADFTAEEIVWAVDYVMAERGLGRLQFVETQPNPTPTPPDREPTEEDLEALRDAIGEERNNFPPPHEYCCIP